MQTASLPEFLGNMSKGNNLLIVADEVHQIGSRQNSAIMTIPAWARLGLSATPVRYGDPEGTTKIFSYFGEVVPPTMSLMDAVSAGRLVWMSRLRSAVGPVMVAPRSLYVAPT